MTTEVELKYLVLNENVSEIMFELLKQYKILFNHQTKQLINSYFDTPELALRKLDMGLRTRIDGEHIEQTIKTAGIVVGGLHQRPEYNIDITYPFPKLALFPDSIWSNDSDINKLQSQLIPLFTTNFQRDVWTVTYLDSVIEIAFDQGDISASGSSTIICEIELELQEGTKHALFALANILFETFKMRAGVQSKAARGYQLYAGTPEPINNELPLDIEASRDSIEQCFITGVKHCLSGIQLSVEQYIKSKDVNQLANLVSMLSLLRHGYWLFKEELTDKCPSIRQELTYFIQLFAWVDNALYLRELMNKTGNYRKKIEYSQRLVEQLKLEKNRFPDYSMTVELLNSARFNKLQLDLLQVLLSSHDDVFEKNNTLKHIAIFAKNKLTNSLSLLTDAMSSSAFSAEDYLAHRKLLHRSLLTGNWFGYLFAQHERFQFRTPWIDMKVGLRELQSLWIIKQQLEKIEKEGELEDKKLVKWQEAKVENLLDALTQSKQAALTMQPYWLL